MKYVSRASIAELGSYLACYSELSGTTHILDAFPAEIMRLISRGPVTREDIDAHIADAVGDGTLCAAVDDVLRQLEHHGLVDVQACDGEELHARV